MPLRMLRQKIMCSRPPELHNLFQERNRRGGSCKRHLSASLLGPCSRRRNRGKNREIQGRVPKRAIGGTPPLGPEELGAGEFCWKVLRRTGDQTNPWLHLYCRDPVFPHSFLLSPPCNLPLSSVLEDGKPVLVRGEVWTQCSP